MYRYIVSISLGYRIYFFQWTSSNTALCEIFIWPNQSYNINLKISDWEECMVHWLLVYLVQLSSQGRLWCMDGRRKVLLLQKSWYSFELATRVRQTQRQGKPLAAYQSAKWQESLGVKFMWRNTDSGILFWRYEQPLITAWVFVFYALFSQCSLI